MVSPIQSHIKQNTLSIIAMAQRKRMQTCTALFFSNLYINFSPQSAPPLLEGLNFKLVNLSFCSTSSFAAIFNNTLSIILFRFRIKYLILRQSDMPWNSQYDNTSLILFFLSEEFFHAF